MKQITFLVFVLLCLSVACKKEPVTPGTGGNNNNNNNDTTKNNTKDTTYKTLLTPSERAVAIEGMWIDARQKAVTINGKQQIRYEPLNNGHGIYFLPAKDSIFYYMQNNKIDSTYSYPYYINHLNGDLMIGKPSGGPLYNNGLEFYLNSTALSINSDYYMRK